MNCSFLGVPDSIQAYGVIPLSYALYHLSILWQRSRKFPEIGEQPLKSGCQKGGSVYVK
jgi:hypothetical protein